MEPNCLPDRHPDPVHAPREQGPSSTFLVRLLCPDGDSGGYLSLVGRVEEFVHEADHLWREEWIVDGVVDAEGGSFHHFDSMETDILQFLDEDTLRQGPGYSTRPG